MLRFGVYVIMATMLLMVGWAAGKARNLFKPVPAIKPAS